MAKSVSFIINKEEHSRMLDFSIGLVIGLLLGGLLVLEYFRYQKVIIHEIKKVAQDVTTAPYAVCKECKKLVAGYTVNNNNTVTCHNCKAEGKV